jgi:hypothetical protein
MPSHVNSRGIVSPSSNAELVRVKAIQSLAEE